MSFINSFKNWPFFLLCRTYFRYSLLLPFCFKINLKFLWSGNLLQRYVFFAFLLMFWTKAPSCVTLLFHNNIQNFHPSSGLFKKESRASGGLWVKHWLRKDCIVVSFAWLTTKKGTCKNLWSLWRDRHFLKMI